MPPRQEPYWSTLLLLLVCSLSFGIHIPQLGFYWDDYASLYVYQHSGKAVFVEWVNGQGRPLAGYLFGALMEITGQQPIGFHLLNFLCYTLGVWVFWRVLRALWPTYPTLTTLTALLFAVYPSYHLRPIAIGIQITLSVALLLASFWLGLLAVRRRSFLLSFLSAGLIVLYPLLYEQGWFYETLRPLVLGYLLYQQAPLPFQQWRAYLKPLLTYWSPQLLGGLAFVGYRMLFYEPNSTYATYNQPVRLESLDGLLLTFKSSFAAPIKLLTADWVTMPQRIFGQQGADLDLPALLGVGFLAFGLLYLWRYPMQVPFPKGKAFAVVVIAWPMMSLTLALVYSVGNDLGDGTFSRWALIPSLLAVVVLALGVSAIIRQTIHAQVVLLLLVVLGLMCQVGTVRLYIQDWQARRELAWQLTWRAPQVQPQTMVAIVGLEDDLAFGRSTTDYEMTAWLSQFYPQADYPRLVGAETPSIINLLMKGQPHAGDWGQTISGREVIYRDWDFSLDRLLVLGWDGGCLKVADPATQTQAMDNATFRNLAPYHQPTSIQEAPLSESPAALDTRWLGPEPAHTWCFYYQQIGWALQMGEDVLAVQLADAALQAGYAPLKGYEVEWLPLVDAYERVGRAEAAQALRRKVAFGPDYAQTLLDEQG